MTSSATPPTRPQIEPINISYYNVQLSKMADELDSSSSEFSPIQAPLFLILLWNQMFWKVKLRIVVKKQLTLNAKVLMVNGENHQRQKTNGECKLASTKSLNIRTAGGFISEGFSLTKTLRMWIRNYGNDFRNRPELKPSKSAGKSLCILQVKNNSRISIQLNVGFCRKFVTPANQCYENNVPKERKALLSVAWMKVL